MNLLRQQFWRATEASISHNRTKLTPTVFTYKKLPWTRWKAILIIIYDKWARISVRPWPWPTVHCLNAALDHLRYFGKPLYLRTIFIVERFASFCSKYLQVPVCSPIVSQQLINLLLCRIASYWQGFLMKLW